MDNIPLNPKYLNDYLKYRFMVEANINYDFENSDKSFSLEDNPTCIPHLIEKINCLKSEKNEKDEEN